MKKSKFLFGLAVVAALGVFFFVLETSRYRHFVQSERQQARLLAGNLKERIEHELLDFMLRARGLTTAVELSGEIGQGRFNHIAERFMLQNDSVIDLALVENGIITLVHPLDENRHLIGYDLRNNRDQWPAVKRSQHTGQVTVQGPVQLLQGKTGFLVRTPMAAFGSDAGRGADTKIVTVVIDASAVLDRLLDQKTAAERRDPGFRVALKTMQAGGNMIGSPGVFDDDPEVTMLAVPGNAMRLGVVPDAGWATGYRIAWIPNLGLLLIVLTTLFFSQQLLRQRAERNKARLQLNMAIETLPDGFVLYDAEDRLVLCNRNYREIYSKSADALVPGNRFEDILRAGLENGQYADAIGREEAWLEARLAARNAANSSFEQQLSDGTWLRIFERAMPDGGRVGVRVDITELKRQQAELEASNAELREALARRDLAEKRFSNVAELSRDWLWEMDKDLRFTYLSDSYLRNDVAYLLGKTRREAHQDHPQVFDTADWEWLDEKERAHEPFRDFIYQAIGATKDNKWIRTSGVPVFDENGEFAGYRGVGSDISQVYNAKREAEAANAAKTEFLNVMTHELRTPLTVILGYNALMAKPEVMPSIKAMETHIESGTVTSESAERHLVLVKQEIAKFASKMDMSGRHLLNLINDILDLAKIEAGKLNIAPHPVQIEPLIGFVVDQLAETARQKSLDLNIECGGGEVLADELRLRQVLINLVGNALKFTDQGHVTIRTEQQGDQMVFHVEDTGCGIPREKLETIFDKFDQVDASGTRGKGGTGLGLSISQHLVELQGGKVTAQSELGIGSTFSFSLPLPTHAEPAQTIAA